MIRRTAASPVRASFSFQNAFVVRRSVWAILAFLTLTAPAFAQKHKASSDPPETHGKKKVEEAYAYQRKLMRGLVTIPDAVRNWARTAEDPDVRKDKDALAISYGCEGLMELEQGEKLRADSLLTRAMPLFQYRKTKAYFIVALAELDKKLSFYNKAMTWYREILTTMDSLPELEEIEFYHHSGYAPYAYAIDAALGTALIGGSKPEFFNDALALLTKTSDKHPTDALGLMSTIALSHLDKAHKEDYKYRLDLLYSRKPELRKVGDNFEKQFVAMP